MNAQNNNTSRAERISKLEQENRELREQLSAASNTEALNERIGFEKSIFSICSLFMGKHGLDKSVYQALQLFGILAEADRVYLYRMNQKTRLMHLSHEYIDADRDLIKRPSASFSPDRESWLLQQLQSQDIIYIDDLASMPVQAVRETSAFVSRGTKSLLLFPLTTDRKIEGFFGFDYITSFKKWESHDLEAVKFTTGLIGFAIEQQQCEKSMRKAGQLYEKIFEHTGAATLILKPDSTIIKANIEFEQLTGYKRKEIEANMKLLNLIDRKDCAVLQKYLLLLISNPEAVPKH